MRFDHSSLSLLLIPTGIRGMMREVTCLYVIKLNLPIHHRHTEGHDWWRIFQCCKNINDSHINSHEHLPFCEEAINFLWI